MTGTFELSPAIDTAAIQRLESRLGVPALIEMQHRYIAMAERRIAALADACVNQQWQEAGQLAVDIETAASSLGLATLALAAKAFVATNRTGANAHAMRNVAQVIFGEHMRACKALKDRHRDMA